MLACFHRLLSVCELEKVTEKTQNFVLYFHHHSLDSDTEKHPDDRQTPPQLKLDTYSNTCDTQTHTCMNKEAAEDNPQGQITPPPPRLWGQSDACRAGYTLSLPHNHRSPCAPSFFMSRRRAGGVSWCFHTCSVLFLVWRGQNEAFTVRVRIRFPLKLVMLNKHAAVVLQGTLDALEKIRQMVKSCTIFCLHASKS